MKDICMKFLQVLNIHTPLKRKLLLILHHIAISKTLRKAITRRSYLGKIYFKKGTDHSLIPKYCTEYG